jgi:3-oxoacyl-[acyl-carrier protein] reductase
MLKNKVVLVSGGSRGIGRAIALEFAHRGAKVALLYAGNEQAAAQTVDEIEVAGGTARAWQCDVRSFADTKAVCDEVLSAFTGVDILVNNAGITRDGLVMRMSEEDFDTVLDTNLKGAFHLIRHLSSQFIRRRSGRIINISSVAGVMGNAGQANYASAKAGLIGLTKTIAKEFGSRGITCNAIAPGFIETDMTGALPEKVVESAMAGIPIKRMGKAGRLPHSRRSSPAMRPVISPAK